MRFAAGRLNESIAKTLGKADHSHSQKKTRLVRPPSCSHRGNGTPKLGPNEGTRCRASCVHHPSCGPGRDSSPTAGVWPGCDAAIPRPPILAERNPIHETLPESSDHRSGPPVFCPRPSSAQTAPTVDTAGHCPEGAPHRVARARRQGPPLRPVEPVSAAPTRGVAAGLGRRDTSGDHPGHRSEGSSRRLGMVSVRAARPPSPGWSARR